MSDTLKFYNYAVGFIDLLGQRKHFEHEGLLPQFETKEQETAFHDKVKATIGAIDDLQRSAEQFHVAATEFKSPFVGQLPENLRGPYEEARKHRVHKQNWSDGVVHFTALGYPDIKVPMNSVFHLLTNLGSMCLLGLAKKRPIRGGFEVAWGVELRPGELYGCAVAKAYQLESEIAQCPRIVLGPYILNYLQQSAGAQPTSIFDEVNRRLAHLRLGMIVEDLDGKPIVHYLGDEFQRFISRSSHAYLFGKAMEFIGEQLQVHKSTGDNKLTSRYEHLRQYFIDHTPRTTPP